MKTYTIIAGVNGAGKSSLAGSIRPNMDDLGIIIDVDKITATQFAGDEYEGGKAAIQKIESCISSGVNFTQETTLSGGYTKKVAQQALDAGYYIRMFYIGIDSMEETIRRIQNRVALGGHNIPMEDIERRFARRLTSLQKILPYCNKVVFYDNRNGFTEVGEYRNGRIVATADSSPAWLVELMAAVNEH